MAYNKETGMYEGYIYIILNDIYPDKIYVGQTSATIESRWCTHRAQIKNHTNTDKLHNLMEKYGVEHFVVEGIEKCTALTKKDLILRLNEKEKYYINKFDSYYNGLNATKGGRDGMDHKMRAIKKFDLYGNFISEYESIDELKSVFNFNCVSSIYSCCMGEIKYAYGSIWRYKEDELSRYSLPSENEIKEATIRFNALNQINKYDCYGNLVATYKNASEAALANKLKRSKIIKCCTGENIYANTYIYRFACDKFDTYKYYSDKPKLVEQKTLDGVLLHVYSSAREAGRVNNISGSQISAVCRGELKQCKGYIWRYVEDPLKDIIPDFKHNGHCKTIYQYDKYTYKLINIYKSIKEAGENTGVNPSTISSIARGNKDVVKTHFVWSYIPLSEEEIKLKCRDIKSKKVSAYDLNNMYVCTYNSAKIASKSLFLPKNADVLIHKCCNKKQKNSIWI